MTLTDLVGYCLVTVVVCADVGWCVYSGPVTMAHTATTQVTVTANGGGGQMIYRTLGALIGKQQTVVASTTTTAYEASRLMAEHQVGAVAVLEQGGLVGIFTERDLLNRVVAVSRDPQAVTLAEVMTAAPITVREDQTLVHALDIMLARHFRHLPVVDKSGALKGVISSRGVPLEYKVMRERWHAAHSERLAAAA